MRWLKGGVRFFLVTGGIILLTSFTIDATDSLRNSQTALGIFARSVTEGECPNGTTRIDLGERGYCIDIYENSVGPECGLTTPTQSIDTKNNIARRDCLSESVADSVPWTFVTYHQAKELCAKRGMRLPSSDEWYEAALGTPVDEVSCNVEGTLQKTGVTESCVSAREVYDMIGNVWEWVDEEVQDGTYNDRTLPEEGYVAEADAEGVALATAEGPQELFDDDYFWHTKEGSFVMMRGGFHGSGEDAGIYSIHTETAPSFASPAIGFRCVLDL